MQSLDNFPVEILVQILDPQHSFLAIELWKCGSSRLNYKLSHGGVTNIELNTRAPTSRWPRCLKEFKLERLIVNALFGKALCSTATLRKELKKLNSDLKELEITAPGACLALFGGSSKKAVNAGDSDDMDQPKAAKRSKLAETADDLDHQGIWNLDVTWPRMERLTFGGELRGLPPCIFALLPRSLLHLEVTNQWGSSISDFSALPPKLRTLHLPCVITSAKALKTLPRSVTDIGKSIDEAVLVDLAKKPSLLPNLTHFPWEQDAEANLELKEWVLEEDGEWPQSIESLMFAECSADQIFSKELPQALKTLSISASYCDYDITQSYLLKNLPKLLTELFVDKIDFSEIEASMWPSGLVDLSFKYTHFGLHWFYKLPRSLTTLKCYTEEPYYEDFSFDDAPPFELDLALENGRNHLNTIDHDLWQSIKANLSSKPKNANYPTAYITAVESGLLFGLPLSLTSLDLGWTLHHEKYDLLLPPSLKEHRTMIGKRYTTPNFFELLPPSLHSLEYFEADYTPTEPWEAFSTTDLAESGIYCASNLRSLNISVRHDEFAFGSAFKYLPRTLEKLDITAPKSRITAEEVATLPPSLTVLHLELRKMESPQGWTHVLPKSLTHLVSDVSIAGSEFAALPPNLEWMSIRAYDVTLDHLLALPKRLGSVSIYLMKYSATTTTDGFLHNHTLERFLEAFSPFWRIHNVPREELLEDEALLRQDLAVLESETAHDAFSVSHDSDGEAGERLSEMRDEMPDVEVMSAESVNKSEHDEAENEPNDEIGGGPKDDASENEIEGSEGDEANPTRASDSDKGEDESELGQDDEESEEDEDGEEGGENEEDDEGEEDGADEDEEDGGDEEQDEQNTLTPEALWKDPQQDDIDKRTIRRFRGVLNL